MKIKFLIIISILLFPNHIFADPITKRGISDIKKSSKIVQKTLADISNSNKILDKFNYIKSSSEKILNTTEVQRYRGGGNIYKKNKNKVALIMNPTSEAIGAGSLLDMRGNIITNWHVIEGAKDGVVAVAFEGTDLETIIEGKKYVIGKVILINKEKDLAVVNIQKIPGSTRPVSLGRWNNINVGDTVHVIGHPQGLLWTYAKGVVSAKRPKSPWNYENSNHVADVIQHQTPISQGNSGGALFDEKGNLLGINTFLLPGGQNLNFAVAVEHAMEIVRNPKKFQSDNSGNATKEKKYDCFRTEDFDKDGKIDTCYVDDNNNGIADGYWVDDNEDGTWEAFHSDKNEDKKVEVILVDTNNNGKWDLGYMDTNGDNKDDVVGYDYNEDGEWDEFKKIT